MERGGKTKETNTHIKNWVTRSSLVFGMNGEMAQWQLLRSRKKTCSSSFHRSTFKSDLIVRWFIWLRGTACRWRELIINFPIDRLSSFELFFFFNFPLLASLSTRATTTLLCVDAAVLGQCTREWVEHEKIKIENKKKILILFWSGWRREGEYFFVELIPRHVDKKNFEWAREREREENLIGKSFARESEWKMSKKKIEEWKSSSSSSTFAREDFLVQSGKFESFQRRIIMFFLMSTPSRMRQPRLDAVIEERISRERFPCRARWVKVSSFPSSSQLFLLVGLKSYSVGFVCVLIFTVPHRRREITQNKKRNI